MNIQLNSYKNSTKLNSFHNTKNQGQAGAFETILRQTLANSDTNSHSNRVIQASRATLPNIPAQWQRA